jgi:ornithine cyclodeaminase
MARAHVALRPGLQRVCVWGRRPEAAQALAASLGEALGQAHPGRALQVEACKSLEPAVRDADLICCATTATEPLVQGAWLRPGTHLDLVGGFRRDMREVDDEAVRRARAVVDTYAGALAEAGDLTQPIERGVIDRAHVRAELAELVADPARGRTAPSDITLFKSVGTALEDLAAARCVLEG